MQLIPLAYIPSKVIMIYGKQDVLLQQPNTFTLSLTLWLRSLEQWSNLHLDNSITLQTHITVRRMMVKLFCLRLIQKQTKDHVPVNGSMLDGLILQENCIYSFIKNNITDIVFLCSYHIVIFPTSSCVLVYHCIYHSVWITDCFSACFHMILFENCCTRLPYCLINDTLWEV